MQFIRETQYIVLETLAEKRLIEFVEIELHPNGGFLTSPLEGKPDNLFIKIKQGDMDIEMDKVEPTLIR